MKENLNDANPANNFCAPHTLINAGKQSPVVSNHAEDFSKKLKKVIQYPGKAQDLDRDVFDGTIMNDCGVKIFYVAKFIIRILKNHAGSLLVCSKKKVRKVDKEVVTGIWPQKNQLIWVWRY